MSKKCVSTIIYCTEFQATTGTILTEIGKLMNELCKNTLDLARFESWLKNMEMKKRQTKGYKQVWHIIYHIALKTACLLDPDNIATLRRAILENTLVENLFPLVTSRSSCVRFVTSSEKTPVITGCTVLNKELLLWLTKQTLLVY